MEPPLVHSHSKAQRDAGRNAFQWQDHGTEHPAEGLNRSRTGAGSFPWETPHALDMFRLHLSSIVKGVSIAMGVPPNRWFIVYFKENPIKMDDEEGYHHFWKPPL